MKDIYKGAWPKFERYVTKRPSKCGWCTSDDPTGELPYMDTTIPAGTEVLRVTLGWAHATNKFHICLGCVPSWRSHMMQPFEDLESFDSVPYLVEKSA